MEIPCFYAEISIDTEGKRIIQKIYILSFLMFLNCGVGEDS